ncbi:hypothetical protein LY76DRAFT_47436 [Colletotrichum caudatum]|nr:hypothetical protein LY76DRAFT_47436 [Colletotrichum caudatum]
MTLALVSLRQRSYAWGCATWSALRDRSPRRGRRANGRTTDLRAIFDARTGTWGGWCHVGCAVAGTLESQKAMTAIAGRDAANRTVGWMFQLLSTPGLSQQ